MRKAWALRKYPSNTADSATRKGKQQGRTIVHGRHGRDALKTLPWPAIAVPQQASIQIHGHPSFTPRK